jgi:hypothetical protein
LRHPQVVRVLEFGTDAGNTPFLVMTYAPHGTLRHRRPKGTIVAQNARAWVADSRRLASAGDDKKALIWQGS